MKIAYVNLGRRAIYGVCLAKGLAKVCDLMAVVSRHSEHHTSWQELPICGYVEVDTPSEAKSFFRFGALLIDLMRAARQVRAFKPDAAVIPMQSPITPLLCALLGDTPVVMFEHDPILHEGADGFWRRAFQWICRRQAHRIVVLSECFVPVLVEQGFDRTKIDLIPHGTFDYYITPRSHAQKKEMAREPTLLFFGRLEPYKGIEILLEAFRMVKDSIPRARLVIVGSGSFAQYREQAASIHGLEVVNKWIADSEVGEFFSATDAVVVPYTSASQSGVIEIARAFGVPVIASNVGGLREQVREGRSGLLVPPSDIRALGDACVSILSDPGFRESMGAEGAAPITGGISWDEAAALLCTACQKAAGVEVLAASCDQDTLGAPRIVG
ncbi:MAG: glycosyltransferase [Bryobacteraceae bacterium]|nr:glycosyltransferase [Bryobacteraceae bacterium]